MLTVKVIEPSGEETIKEVTSVFFTPDVGTPGEEGSTRAFVTFFEVANPIGHSVTHGLVYVMNENGKTVADYHLGSSLSEMLGK